MCPRTHAEPQKWNPLRKDKVPCRLHISLGEGGAWGSWTGAYCRAYEGLSL